MRRTLLALCLPTGLAGLILLGLFLFGPARERAVVWGPVVAGTPRGQAPADQPAAAQGPKRPALLPLIVQGEVPEVALRQGPGPEHKVLVWLPVGAVVRAVHGSDDAGVPRDWWQVQALRPNAATGQPEPVTGWLPTSALQTGRDSPSASLGSLV